MGSRHLARRPSKFQANMASIAQGRMAVSTVVEAELRFRAEKSPDPRANRAAIEGFLVSVAILPFDSFAAKEYGVLRAYLERTGQLIGGNDMMIASICLACGLILVTHNTAEFARVPGLVVEDWEA